MNPSANRALYDSYGFCKLVTSDRYYVRGTSGWDLEAPLTKEGILDWLQCIRGLDESVAKEVIKKRRHHIAFKIGLAPSEPEFYLVNNQPCLNLYQRPTLEVVEGEWPHIEEVIDRLTGASKDPAAKEWFLHLLAAKYQNPAYLPLIGTVFPTTQGAGKSFLYLVCRELFGPANCVHITRGSLEGNFNANIAGKVFVFADEIVSTEQYKSISEKLKYYVANPHIEVEAKYMNPVTVPNCAMWIFGSNHGQIPIVLDKDDRRYTILPNFEPIPQAAKDRMKECFRRGGGFTEDFMPEVRAFAHYLKNLAVDYKKISAPHANEARRIVIESGMRGLDAFVHEIQTSGLAGLGTRIGKHYFDPRGITGWDEMPPESKLYEMFKGFCAKGKYGVSNESHFRGCIRSQIPEVLAQVASSTLH